jgi:hypothetical protein
MFYFLASYYIGVAGIISYMVWKEEDYNNAVLAARDIGSKLKEHFLEQIGIPEDIELLDYSSNEWVIVPTTIMKNRSPPTKKKNLTPR